MEVIPKLSCFWVELQDCVQH